MTDKPRLRILTSDYEVAVMLESPEALRDPKILESIIAALLVKPQPPTGDEG